jgi:beta-1,4-mannosyltransferase
MNAPSASGPLLVSARPAWKAPNPYSGLLADALQVAGAEVSESDRRFGRLPTKPTIMLYHWPDEFFFLRGTRRAVRALALAAELAVGKLVHGHKVVWVAHNIVPHQRDGRRFRLGTMLFLRLIDGLVFLSETSRSSFARAYPRLRDTPAIVIAHGDYRPCAVRPVTAARPVVDRPVRIAFIGQVNRYKAPDVLARRVAALLAGRAELTIAGSCEDASLAAELAAIAADCTRVRLDLRYLSAAEIEEVTDRADVVILPYRDILNSGSALLALSRARPIIAPRLGSLIELQEQVGVDWVWLYEGDLTDETMSRGLAWVAETRRAANPDLSAHDWGEIGKRTAGFLRKLARC